MNPSAGPASKIVLWSCLFASYGAGAVGILVPYPRMACLAPFFMGLGLALVFTPRANEEGRAEYARWLASWSTGTAGERWLRRFLRHVGNEARHGDPDPLFYSPLAVHMVVWSLTTMPRPRRMRRMVEFWIGRLERYGLEREGTSELPKIRSLVGVPPETHSPDWIAPR